MYFFVRLNNKIERKLILIKNENFDFFFFLNLNFKYFLIYFPSIQINRKLEC